MSILHLESQSNYDYVSKMKELFVPYAGSKPASIDINGHSLLIVSRDRDELQAHLSELGGDSLKGIHIADESSEEELMLEALSTEVNGGVVVAPDGTNLRDVIRSLELELPWLQ